MPIASTRKMWMSPPMVTELMVPRSQRTAKINANVDTVTSNCQMTLQDCLRVSSWARRATASSRNAADSAAI